jgi:hypothetical protein
MVAPCRAPARGKIGFSKIDARLGRFGRPKSPRFQFNPIRDPSLVVARLIFVFWSCFCWGQDLCKFHQIPSLSVLHHREKHKPASRKYQAHSQPDHMLASDCGRLGD